MRKKSKMNWITILVSIAVGIAVLIVLARFFVQSSSPMPSVLGVRDGSLSACPDSPNCVSTQGQDEIHQVEPLLLEGSEAEARARLIAIIEEMPRATVIANEPNYIHAEFRSFVWGFVDDVEFFIDEEQGMIHNRSASRLGYSDLDVNRNRYEEIKVKFGS